MGCYIRRLSKVIIFSKIDPIKIDRMPCIYISCNSVVSCICSISASAKMVYIMLYNKNLKLLEVVNKRLVLIRH